VDGKELDQLRAWLERQGVLLRLAPADSEPAALDAATPGLSLPDGRRLQFEATQPAPLDEPTAPPGAVPVSEYQLLAEHSGDLVVAVDQNLVLRFASSATAAMLGWAPGELVGHSLAELLVREECASFIARHFTQAARHGSGPDLFRLQCRDGRTPWVEARVSPLPPGSRLGSYVVTLRDATRRRLAEEALAAANQELAALATTDALTGLPNRRQFDITLRKEWFRAQREAAPVALLMIDIDHFKALNDRHGHPVGDAFLARVGRVIGDTVRRASDLAARYGGEEFVVVLPATGAAGAREMGEHIRAAVAATDFSDLVPGGHRLTVSVGLATRVPQAGSTPDALLHDADLALYQAKRLGRNRVEMQK
jgi:diguanylate cyclase (GGDEF)-like protein/PAS domain S-box-containing protein